MKTKISLSLKCLTGAALLAVIGLLAPPLKESHAAGFEVPTQALRGTAPISPDLRTTNQNDTVALKIGKASTVTSNPVEVIVGTSLVASVSPTGAITTAGGLTNNALTASLPVFTDANKAQVSKSIANTLLALGIQSGRVTNVNKFTNQVTFATAFSSAPRVFVSGPTNSLPHIFTAATTTTVTFGSGATNDILDWIAIGAP